MAAHELEALFALDPEARYSYFLETVAARGEAWGLHSDGWALLGSETGEDVLPLWPARELAQQCASAFASTLAAPGAPEPAWISRADLVEKLLPSLRRDGVGVAVFPTPDGRGPTPSPARLLEDLGEPTPRSPRPFSPSR